MSPILAGVALAVTAGAVIATSSREARAALIGLTLVLGLGPFLAEPLPGPALLGARVVTGILVAYVLWAAAGTVEVRGLGSRIGWPAEAMLAVAAATAGVAIASTLASLEPGSAAPIAGPLDALTPSGLILGAGLALAAIGLAPALLGRVSLRATIGLLLLTQGVALARTGIAGAPGELEQLGVDGILLAVGVAGALIAGAARSAAAGGVAGAGAAGRGAAVAAPPGRP
ncbi:MAG TPA: hypothetical protein VLS28_09395 [Candidatus Sulfomarinibacteraceae bacterium]|nr:hypothetical protein [Candidatus Sulfomarinibacteraceae bacterium]